jgi:hypothetical protein
MESISVSKAEACSSSPAPSRDGFTALLEESLRAVERDCPAAYREMAIRLRGLEIDVEVGRERLVVRGGPAGHEVIALPTATATAGGVPAAPRASLASLVTRPEVLLALLEGDARLVDCVLDDRLRLSGPLPTLLQLNEALTWYLRGAVRSPACPGLVARLAAWSQKEAKGTAP